MFKFTVKLSEKDYFEFNKFVAISSPYGKKQIRGARIALTVFAVVLGLISLYGGDFTAEAFIGIIPLLVFSVLLQVFYTKLMELMIKSYIKSVKKRGTPLYDPESVLEFYDDRFVEITPDAKTELKYSSIERAFVVDKCIYLLRTHMSGFILTMTCFESTDQFNSFVEFIGTKASDVETVNK